VISPCRPKISFDLIVGIVIRSVNPEPTLVVGPAFRIDEVDVCLTMRGVASHNGVPFAVLPDIDLQREAANLAAFGDEATVVIDSLERAKPRFRSTMEASSRILAASSSGPARSMDTPITWAQ
jgi:hypothetical protein